MPEAKSKAEIAAILTSHYPLVHRLANGLCGDSAAAAKVARAIMIQSLGVADRWRGAIETENWFLHHTLLESRQVHAPSPLRAASADMDLQAFAKALCGLPSQQREAFILTHGEHLDIRRTAIAMDCSTTAAGNHMAAAVNSLKSIAGQHFDRLAAQMLAAYAAPPPAADLVIGYAVRAAARREAWRRILLIALVVGGLAAVWVAYRISRMLDY